MSAWPFRRKVTARVIVHPGERGRWWWRIVDKDGKTLCVQVGNGHARADGAEAAAERFLNEVGARPLEVVREAS